MVLSDIYGAGYLAASKNLWPKSAILRETYAVKRESRTNTLENSFGAPTKMLLPARQRVVA